MRIESEIIERPILFKGEMVRGIQEGRKWKTRRANKLNEINEDPDNFDYRGVHDNHHEFYDIHWDKSVGIKCPYGIPGDRLWVREAWQVHFMYDDLPPREINQKGWREGDGIKYLAGGQTKPDISWGKTRVSIHMPRWVSRILLEVTSIDVERLQSISKKEAIAEGVVKINDHYLMDPEILKTPVKYSNETKLNDERYWGNDNPVGAFAAYFEKINGPDAWDINPWVWVVGFKNAF